MDDNREDPRDGNEAGILFRGTPDRPIEFSPDSLVRIAVKNQIELKESGDE